MLLAPASVPTVPPTLTAESAILIDDATGAVLFEKNSHERKYPASTTKIMTALLLVEHCKMDDKITAPADVKTVGESSIYLEPFEVLSVKDALYALMVRSANDVAYAVACHISGTVEQFADLMNKRATELGCTETTFRNPHGLRNKDHMTSAHDLALIAREAMKHSEIRQACRTRRVLIERSINQLNRYLVSKDRFLEDPSAEGVKTGFTIPAGSCFVGAKRVNGWRLITVVLKSGDWLGETKSLMDYGFAKFRQDRPLGEGADCGQVSVASGESNEVQAVAGRTLSVVANRGGYNREPKVELLKVNAPIRAGDIVGHAEATNIDGTTVRIPLFAANSVPLSSSPIATIRRAPFAALLTGIGSTAILLFGFALLRRRSHSPKKRQHA